MAAASGDGSACACATRARSAASVAFSRGTLNESRMRPDSSGGVASSISSSQRELRGVRDALPGGDVSVERDDAGAMLGVSTEVGLTKVDRLQVGQKQALACTSDCDGEVVFDKDGRMIKGPNVNRKIESQKTADNTKTKK